MKAGVAGLLLGLAFNICAQIQPGGISTNVTPTNSESSEPVAAYSITSRGPHARKWQRVSARTNELGKVSYQTNSYTELATGLNYWNGSQWVDSSDQIQITANGASATNTQHQVNFAANINTAGSIDLTLPDGQHLKSQIVGLAYYDEASSNSVMFAETRNSTGQLLPSLTQVIYTNCFTDFQADVRYTHSKAKFEQDIVLRTQPPAPAQYGLNPQSTLIQVWTEFINPPEPAISSKTINVSGDGTQQAREDQTLDFGAMQIGRGSALSTDAEIDRAAGVPVAKKWVHAQGRTFLVEEIPLSAIAQELSNLPPPPPSGTNNSPGAGSTGASLKLKLPAPKLQARTKRPLELAKTDPELIRGFVLDYNITVSTLTNFTFKSDTTYYISGILDLYGTNTIEGGTVIKSAATSGGTTFHGTLVSLTAPYRPAIFTAPNDNTVGIALTNGTTVTNVIVTTYLSISGGGSVTNMRFSYARNALAGDAGDIEVSDCQFIDCDHPITINSSTTNLGLHNVLITMTNTINKYLGSCSCQPGALTSYSQAVNIYGENVTMDLDSQYLMTYFMSLSAPSNTTVRFTNSILITPSLDACYVGGAPAGVTASTNSTFYATTMPSGLFTNVGAANYYLPTNSPYHACGSANISPGLLASLKYKTTYAPLCLTNLLTNNTVLAPQAQRDTSGNPDLGYHYPAIDYLSACSVSNATLALTNGVVLAYYNTGILLQANADLVSQGTPNSHNCIVYYRCVQEQATNLWTAYSAADALAYAIPLNSDLGSFASSPTVYIRFTTVVLLNGTWNVVSVDDGWNPIKTWNMRDCELYCSGSSFLMTYGSTTPTLTLSNNLIVYPWGASIGSLGPIVLYNNTFVGDGEPNTYFQYFGGGSSPNVSLNNCFFNCDVYLDGNYNNNAYVNSSPFEQWPPDASYVTGDITWEPGPLGDYYQANNSPLINQGNTNANLLGLYHYTTQTNQTPETNSIVDIGYHYVSTDSAGNPVDSNGNGIPDYLEDADGSGAASIVITNPTNSESFTGPLTLSIQTGISDWAGTVTNVTFYRGNALIGSVTNSPFTCSWTNAPAGVYSLTAVATDNKGLIMTSPAVNITVSGPCSYTYSSNNAFGIVTGTNGWLMNLNYTNSLGALELNTQAAPLHYLNLPCKTSNTMLRLNIDSSNFVGEYLTTPQGKAGYPGHSVVDRFGNTWVANWAEAGNNDGTSNGSITEIGVVIGGTRGYKTNVNATNGSYTFVPNANGQYLKGPFQYCTAVDRDGDGLIKTSFGQGNVLPWPTNASVTGGGSVNDAQDECVINYVRTPARLVSAMALDTNNDLWVGGYCNNNSPDCPSNDTCYPHLHVKISGITGQVLTNTEHLFSTNGFSYGGFEALAGANGLLWSSGGGNSNANISLLNYSPGTGTTNITVDTNNYFGMAIDPQTSNVWVTAFRESQVYVFSPSGTYRTNYYHGDTCGGGLAIDNNGNVWIAHGPWLGSQTVGHLRTNGTWLGNVDISGCSGGNNANTVSIDSNGKVWAICASSSGEANLVRIDPNQGSTNDGYRVGAADFCLAMTNEGPRESYGDMTGQKLLAGTSPSGFWSVTDDSGESGTPWNTLTWNASTSDTNQILVQVRAADQSAQLTSNAFQVVQNGVPLTNVIGEFLQIQVTLLRPSGTSDNPTFHDLTVTCAGSNDLSVTLLTPTDGSHFGPDSSVTFSATATPDVGRSITQVEFRDNGTNSVGTVSDSPYQLTLPFLPTGTNQITAVATESGGLMATSAFATVVVYARPTVNLLYPTNGASFVEVANLTNLAHATAAGAGISNVAFISGTNLWGNGTNSGTNYGLATSLAAGAYPLMAVATDSNGVQGYSSTIVFKVTSANTPPYVAITTPTNNSSFQANANITITAVATNADNSITNVDFYSGGQWLGNATNSPYSILVCCWSPGDYALTAVAQDSHGTSATSSNINIHVASDMPLSTTAGFWDPTFTLQTSDAQDDFIVKALLVDGANLYVEREDGPTAFSGLSLWNGSTWSSWEDDSTYPFVHTYGMVMYQGLIYVTGDDAVVKWNGSEWQSVGDTLSGWGSWVYNLSVNHLPDMALDKYACLAVVGSDLYVGGGFTNSATNGTNVQYIAKLNQTNNTWESVGNGLDGPVFAITSYQGHLVVSGGFTTAGSNTNAVHVAELIGDTWTNLGQGLTGPDANAGYQVVVALASCGTNLFAGGDFTTADGNTNANGIAVWNGRHWSPMAQGFVVDTNFYQGVANSIYSISARGNTVFAGGIFGGIWTGGTNQAVAYNIAQASWSEENQEWDWAPLDLGVWDSSSMGPIGPVYSTAIMDGPSGNIYDLFVGGEITDAGSAALLSGGAGLYTNLARWSVGGAPIGSLPKIAITSPARALQLTNAASVTLTANVFTNNTNVSSVQFFDGAIGLGSIASNSTATYTQEWSTISTGLHTMTAVAFDTNSRPSQSAPVMICNNDSNNPIYMGQSFYKIAMNSPAVSLHVLTNDTGGGKLSIAQILHPNNTLGTAVVSHDASYITYTPYAHTYGTDVFVYEVTNNLTGTFGASNLALVTVQICSPPSIILTNPADNQFFDTNQNITISGTASDYDGWVTNITLYVNGVNFGHTTNANFSFTLNTNVADFYSLVAVATDNDGFTNASVPITIAVTNSGTASSVITADILNLTQTENILGDTVYTVVTQGLFNLQGDANDSNLADPVSYQILIYATDGSGTLLADVTPQPVNAQGFHSGRATNDLGTLNLTTLPNGIYDLVLTVHGGAGAASMTRRFTLDTQLKVGQFSFSEQDVSLPVNGIPITIVRTYNSLNNLAGDFGYDWSFAINSMDISLNEERQDFLIGGANIPYPLGDPSSPDQTVSIRTGGGRDVTLTLPDGRRTTFNYVPLLGFVSAEAQWQAQPNVHASLVTRGNPEIDYPPFLTPFWKEGMVGSDYVHHDTPGWLLTTQDGTRYVIGRGLGTNVVYNPSGTNNISVQVYGTPRLTAIIQTNGESLAIGPQGITHYTSNNVPTRSLYFDRDGVGRIIAVHDPVSGPNGVPVLQYVYDQGKGNLLQVLKLVDRNARTYTTNKYHYDNPNFPHYITSIESPTGAPLARNEYDDSGKLIAVVDAQGNRTQFLHDTTNQLEAVTDRLNNTSYYAYDTQGNVTAQTNALNEVVRYGYDSQNNKTNQITGYMNGSGVFVPVRTNSSTFDGNGYMLSSTDAMNRTIKFTYDGSGNALTQTDPIGNVVSNSYDGGGNLTGTVQYDTSGTIVGASSSVYNGNLLTQTFDANGNTNGTFGYDASQNLTNATDARGFSHGFGYDDNGNQTSSTYGFVTGGTTTYVTTKTDYDAQNRPYHTVDTFSNETFTYYNSLGKTDHTVDRFGNTTSYLYDDSGNQIQTIDGAGLITKTVYDVAGRPYLTTDRNSVTGTLTVYDAAGRVTNIIRLTGVWLDIVTNAPGSYSSVVTSNGTPYSTNSTTYFSTGWVKSRTTPDGYTTTYDYWPDGQVKTVTDPLTNVTQYAYDNAGRQQQIQDARNHTTQFQYDGEGRQVTTIYNNLSFTSNTFNTLGQRTSVQDQAGMQTRFGYDVSGTLTNVIKPLVPDPENANAPTHPTWAYTYDSYGRPIVTTDPKGRTNTVSYDAYGRQIAQRLQLGQTNWNVYYTNGSNSGMPWRQYDFLGQRTEFAYDNFGRIKVKFLFNAGATYPSNAICYKFNPLGQVTNITELSGTNATTNIANLYTAIFGKSDTQVQADIGLIYLLCRIPKPVSAGAVACALLACIVAVIPRLRRQECAADFVLAWRAWNRPLEFSRRRMRLPCLSWKVVTYVVILALFLTDDRFNFMRVAHADCSYPGNSSSDTIRVTSYTYDDDGRLTQINAPEGVIDYEYNAATGRHTRTCTTNSDISYDYDQLGRLYTVSVNKRNGHTLGTPEVSTYTYDEVGNRKTLSLPNGIVTTYAYDDLNRLTNISSVNGTTNIAAYTYKLDATGRRTNAVEALLVDTNGTYLTNILTWAYDGMYRLTNETSTSTSAAGNFTNAFSYDLVGNRLKQIHIFASNTTNTDGFFNGNDELLSETNRVGATVVGTNGYAYDGNGSMTNRLQNGTNYSMAYNLQNKLVQATVGTITCSYLYNDSGIRVSSTSSNAGTINTTLYLVDPNNHTGYAQILEELNTAGGASTTSYVIGDDVLGQCGITYTAPSYRLADGHGNTRQMANLSGGVTSRYNYEAYGTLLGSSSSSPETSLRYCGEQFDSILTMYNLRARYYDSSDGKFNQRDTFAGDGFDPESLHKYTYANCDPVNVSDPSGNIGIGGLMVAIGIGALLGAMIGAVYGGIKQGVNGAITYGLGGLVAGGLLAGFVVEGGLLIAAGAGVSEATGIFYSGSIAGAYSIGSTGAEYILAETERDRDAALFALGASLLLQGVATKGFLSIKAGRGTYTDASGGQASALEMQMGRLAANYYAADIISRPRLTTPGVRTPDYWIGLQGKNLELKDGRATGDFDGVMEKISHAQADNVIIILRQGQLTSAEINRIGGRLFSPKAPSSKNSVTIVEETAKGYKVVNTIQRNGTQLLE